MLEKPDLQDTTIRDRLRDDYGLAIVQIIFLPLGADQDAAVYRVVAADEVPYFLKLRRGNFDEVAVKLAKYLHDQGIEQIIAPLVTEAGQFWAELADFRLILYPFVDGHNGYQQNLSDRHWIAFGTAIKKIHSTRLPLALLGGIPTETYSSHWRDTLRSVMERAEPYAWHDPVAAKSVLFLKANRRAIFDLIERTERLARILQARSGDLVVCHADIHAGNILIDDKDALYIVDWDNPIRAPKERDLMFSGGGQFGALRSPQDEDKLFYQGYGHTPIDREALAYYRYERIINDLAVYGEQLLLTNDGGEDREQAFQYLTSNFLSNGTLEIARKTDKSQVQGGR